MKNIYEPNFKLKLQENMNIDFNATLPEVIAGMGVRNAVDCIKILKVKYGVSYKHMATIMGISPSALRTAMNYETFDGVIRENKLIEGILRLQDVYLQDFFCIVEDTEPAEPIEVETYH